MSPKRSRCMLVHTRCELRTLPASATLPIDRGVAVTAAIARATPAGSSRRIADPCRVRPTRESIPRIWPLDASDREPVPYTGPLQKRGIVRPCRPDRAKLHPGKLSLPITQHHGHARGICPRWQASWDPLLGVRVLEPASRDSHLATPNGVHRAAQGPPRQCLRTKRRREEPRSSSK